MSSDYLNSAAVNDFYASFWNSEAWGRAEANEDEGLRAEAISRMIERHVRPAYHMGDLRILDLGCGRGWLTAALSSYGEVLGIDPVSAAVDRAKVLFPNANIRQGTGADLLAQGLGGSFNLVASSEVIEHVPAEEKRSFMNEIAQLLTHDGFAILTTPRRELLSLWSRNGAPGQPVEAWLTESELDQLSESSGLRVVARDRVFLPQFPFDWLSRLAVRSPLLRYTRLQAPVRNHRAIYQVVLLQHSS